MTFAEMERNTKTKELTFTDYIGVCQQNSTYKVTGGHLLMMERVHRVCTQSGEKVFLEKRVNGRMKLVKTSHTKY